MNAYEHATKQLNDLLSGLDKDAPTRGARYYEIRRAGLSLRDQLLDAAAAEAQAQQTLEAQAL